MKFDNLLSRAEDETLQAILGRPGIRLLTLMDRSLVTPSKLREVIIGLYTREGLLLSPEKRALLFDLMSINDANDLATSLGINLNEDIYKALKALRVRRGSSREKILFNFFELVPPPIESNTEAPATTLVEVMHSLFPHQRKAAIEIKKQLSREPYRVLLHMPTGSGKTRTAMHIVADQLRSKESTLVIWLAYSEELCEQAAMEFNRVWKHLGDRELILHRFWGVRELDLDTVSDGIVIASLSKLYTVSRNNFSYLSTLGSLCSLVVMDEAHQAVAETYSYVLDALTVHHPTTALLGLTATPGRTWSDIEEDERLSDFFSRRKVTLSIQGYDNPVDYLVDEGFLAKIEFTSLFYESGLDLSTEDIKRIAKEHDIPQHILDKLADDERRNINIISKVENMAQRHRRILVFAISVVHANLLAAVLRARGFHSNSVTGSTPHSERVQIIENFKDDEVL